MREVDVLVVGAGPAGLAAACACAEAGARTLVVDANDVPGGQLIKQTHKFFGSERQFAGTRGIQIPGIFASKLGPVGNAQMLLGANAVGYYEGGIVGVEQGRNFIKVQARRIILTTGAAERMLAFENNDLPGVYGAGAVQTLMNVHRVLPGRRVLMIGSGNIGLIVSYQLLQAQVEVVAVLEAMPRIGGYLVHAAKLRRAGVPILTSHTIVRAVGEDCVSGAVMERIDDRWRSVPGTETEVKCDVICLAVGLTPLSDLLWQAGCEMKYVPELGGHVPVRDSCLRTSNPSVYIAGDVGGVEEASSAMIQGEIAGISAVMSLGLEKPGHRERLDILARDLQAIRSGPTGEKICRGMQCVTVLEGGAGDGGGR